MSASHEPMPRHRSSTAHQFGNARSAGFFVQPAPSPDSDAIGHQSRPALGIVIGLAASAAIWAALALIVF